MASKGGRRKPEGGPPKCRGIDYSSMISGPRLTDAAIEQYKLAGRYGPDAQRAAQRRAQQKKKHHSKKPAKVSCEQTLKHLLQFIGSPNEHSENMNR